MKNIDSYTHTRGESIYVDDLPILGGTLFAAIFDAPVAHGIIKNIDSSEAAKMSGVKHIISYKDIPGENQIGGIFPDEPSLAEQEIHYQGQPILLVLASSPIKARAALQKIKIEIENLPVVVDAREAAHKGQLIGSPRTFRLGNTQTAWEKCTHIVSGRADTNGQEHLYIEGQAAYAYPSENGSFKIISSTQGPTQVQKACAKVLGLAMHKIELDVRRLGGGFGGKEDQATPWAVLAALGAYVSKKPVKLVLNREEDMRMTGKRHPYSSDFKIGLDDQYKIIAFEADYYQNAGGAADLSPAVLERTLFHATNAYFIPHLRTTAYSCKTNLPPNTAFRGFGGPQGIFVIEAAIIKAAESLGVAPRIIQEKNLLQEGDSFSYGQKTEGCEAVKVWQQACQSYHLEELEQKVSHFNQQNKRYKKGLSILPICFGISFTNTPMNHARALVHIYQDGSLGISTGAVEMGQGVNTKMLQIAALTFSLSPQKIKIESTNTTRVANTSPTAASAGADLNGKALQIACNAIADRLKKFVQEKFELKNATITLVDNQVLADQKELGWTWETLIAQAFLARINLSEKGHYATPTIHFDKISEKGQPFAYHVYGTAITETTVDCLKGTYEIDGVHIVHDYGKSMNKGIDRGQVEGALVQGIGWVTMEELRYNPEGRLLSSALSTYKIPDIYAIPQQIDIEHLDTEGSDSAILKSKAVGEPPLIYGIGTFFAIRAAIKAFNPKAKELFDAPMTHEKVLMALFS